MQVPQKNIYLCVTEALSQLILAGAEEEIRWSYYGVTSLCIEEVGMDESTNIKL